MTRAGVSRQATLALALTVLASATFLAPTRPAAAVGSTSHARQFAGGLPSPFAGSAAVARVGDRLFVAAGQVIFRVGLTASTISILAGRRGIGGSADGIGGNARFQSIQGMTTDGVNLYVADAQNYTIRRVVIATGEVTTIAGVAGQPGSVDGVGSAARFFTPFGISTNDGRNLWITDIYNATIRKLVVATGEVTTFAGTAGSHSITDGVGPAARFQSPNDIVADGGTLWVTDLNSVRKVFTATGGVTTVVTAEPALTAITSVGGSLFVGANYDPDLEGGYFTIQRADPVSGTLTELAATAGEPDGLTTDGTRLYSAENFFVMETRIADGARRPVGNFGAYGAVDGEPRDARFTGTSGLASDGRRLYVIDFVPAPLRAPLIRTVDVLTGAVGTVATTGLVNPLALTVVGPDLFVADGDEIKRVVLATGQVSTFAVIPGAFPSSPADLATDGSDLFVTHADCAVYRVSLASATVSVFAGASGECAAGDGVGTAARFNHPRGIALDGGVLWVADVGSRAVRKIEIATRRVSTLTTFPTNVPLFGGIAAGGGDVYLHIGGIIKVDEVTGSRSTVTPQPDNSPFQPLSYSPFRAGFTNIGGCCFLADLVVDNDGHRLFFSDGIGVGVVSDAKLPPVISVGQTSVVEGDEGTARAVFTVRLTAPQPTPVVVDFTTEDASATAASGDYVAQSGTLEFPAGAVEGRVKVSVNGDTADEGDESFNVVLSDPSAGLVLGRASGRGTVLDDDPASGDTVSIGVAAVVEGDEGDSLAVFPVRLSRAQSAPVTLTFTTGNGTALSPGDYEARSGVKIVPAGATSATIWVKVHGDYDAEPTETFSVTVSDAGGLSISRPTGTGRVITDD